MAANGEIFQFLLNQQRNSSGMLDSGTVTFYTVGTTTLKTVWTDRAKTTPAANPYTLGSNASAELYGDGVYRVVIKDSTGAVIPDGDIAAVELALDTAAASAAAAAASAVAAAASESLAQEWAENPEDVAVTGYPGQYSALHWAAKSSASVTPTGMISAFGMSAVPSGWLECNGAAVSRTTYATLFGVVSTTYGIGDGVTTFNLPDMRAEFPRGWDNGRGVDTGRTIGSTQAEEVGTHTHPIANNVSQSGGTYTYNIGSGTNFKWPGNDTSANTGTENRPRNVALMFCIKT